MGRKQILNIITQENFPEEKKYLKLYIERVYHTLDNGDPKLPISSHTQVKWLNSEGKRKKKQGRMKERRKKGENPFAI